MDPVHCILIGMAALVGETFGTVFGGGSFLIQPALLSVGISPHVAVANDVTAAVFSSIFFSVASFRKLKPDWQIGGWMLPGVIVGASAGGFLLPQIPDNVEKWIILGICCLGLLYMLLNIKKSALKEGSPKRLFPYWQITAVGGGIALGIYEGISGAGSGVLYITTLSLMFRLNMKSAVVVTNLLEIVGLGTAALIFWHLGLLDTKLLAIMIPASCIAGIFGSKIMHSVSEKTLRFVFAGCIALLIIHIAMSSF